jgi:simple sugar transport system substrate-binding protein
MHPPTTRRDTLKILGGTAAVGAASWVPGARADAKPKMVFIHKIAGIPWVNLMKDGVVQGGNAFNIDATLIGPTAADPALQARLVEDVIAQNVAVLGVDPLDPNVLAPLLKRAQDSGIKVLTLEGINQPNRDWDVSMVSPAVYGETIMKQMAAGMGYKGQYVIIVGGLTTPLHKLWADAGVAYQEKYYPEMKQATERFGMGESLDDTQKTVLNILEAHPKVTGFFLTASPSPIGAGNALRQLRNHRVTVVGSCIPSQAQSLLDQGYIKECVLWSPKMSGYAVVAVARVVLDGKPMVSGMNVPGVGNATIAHNATGGIVELNQIIEVTKSNASKYMAQGL